MNIYYDGDCPFCSQYVRMIKLKNVVGQVNLISLRSNDIRLVRVYGLKFNFNKGFLIEYKNQMYFGADAFYLINTLMPYDGVFSKLVNFFLSKKKISSIIYLVMTYMRFVTLFFIGGSLLNINKNFNLTGTLFAPDLLLSRLIRLSFVFLFIVYACRYLYENPINLSFRFSINFVMGLTVFLSIFSFIKVDCVHWLALKLQNLSWKSLFVYICVLLFFIGCMDLIALRRIVAFIVIFPLLRLVWLVSNKSQKTDRLSVVGSWAPFVMLIFAFFPGLYLAPFYGGIAGWTLSIDRSKPIRVSGYQLINHNGDKVWFNHALFQPLSMNGRLERAFYKVDKTGQKYAKFMYETYVREYPSLKSGYLPHQFLLHDFAYPTHNLSKNNATDYSEKFAPDLISKIVKAHYYYDWQGGLIKSEVISTYEISPTWLGLVEKNK